MSDDTERRPLSFRQTIAALADALPVDEAAEREVDRMLAKHHAENPPRKMIAASKLDEANAEIERLNAALDDALNLRRSGIALIDIMRRRYGREARQWQAHHDQRMRERDEAYKQRDEAQRVIATDREHLGSTIERLTKERDDARELFRESEHRWNFAGKKLDALTDSVSGLYASALDSARAEIERLTKDLREFEELAHERGIAQARLLAEKSCLVKENEALSKVYVVAARLRMFPVPFDDHWELVGAVDECRQVLEGDGEGGPSTIQAVQSRTHDADFTQTVLADNEHDDYDWVDLDWVDGPVRSIAMVPRDDLGRDNDMLEVRTLGWQDKHEYQHVRFEREDLQAMLDYIDGKEIRDFQDEPKARSK